MDFEVWVFGDSREKEIIQADDIRAAADQVRLKYQGVHSGFFIVPARSGVRNVYSRFLPYSGTREGGIDYGEEPDQAFIAAGPERAS